MFTLKAAGAILDALVGKRSVANLADTCYIGFSTTEPNLNGTTYSEETGNGHTEPSTEAGYERVLVGSYGQTLTQLFGDAAISEDGATVVMTNTQNIKSNRATAAWGTLTYVLFFNAKTGGSLLAYQALTTPVTVAVGESIQINKGTLKLILK